ncbi:hypothetical protein [Oleiagrimonas sp. C23AA]|nr:hypothetical protein [Oleiagrimonas sp. C23AA]
MSKGLDSKRSEKKKPAMTLKEKRAAKHEKKRLGAVPSTVGKTPH